MLHIRDRARQTREHLSLCLASRITSETFKQTEMILEVERVFRVSARDLSHSVNETSSVSADNRESLRRIEESLYRLTESRGSERWHGSSHGHLVAQLLEAGCDLTTVDINGNTAVHFAATSSAMGSSEILTLLLVHGCRPNLRNFTDQFTHLNSLVHESLARDLWDCEGKIYALLLAKADFDLPDKWGCTPILNASMIPWDNELFKILYDSGVEIDAVDRSGRDILHYAAAYEDLDHIEFLRGLRLTKDQVSTHGQDQNRRTPMSLMGWRARQGNVRKLWTNMKMPSAEEVDTFRSLISEIENRSDEDADLGEADQDVHVFDGVTMEDDGDMEFVDAYEILPP